MNPLAKKLLLGAVLLVAFGGYVYWSSSQNASTTPIAPNPTSAGSETVNPNSGGTSGSVSTGSTTSGSYKGGTYTGEAASSIYGNVQVSATITAGKISTVTFLQHPDSQGHSQEVSAMSMPILQSEAIASQSASVNIVSGATQTSEAFQQSLQSALAQAQA